MLLKVCSFSISAVALCTFNWPMVDPLPKQRWFIWLSTPAFDYDQLKRKENMEYTM